MATADGRELVATLDRVTWSGMPRSATVDMLQFLATTKPAVRLDLALATTAGERSLRRWATEAKFGIADDGSFLVIAKAAVEPATVLAVDRSPQPHEATLGELLGYPRCCSRAVAFVGEANIDRLAARQATWAFVGEFSAIDPSGYAGGRALVSHLPCSPDCTRSLGLARSAAAFVFAAERVSPAREPWRSWLRTARTLLPGDALTATVPWCPASDDAATPR